jgi:hypothetical protein
VHEPAVWGSPATDAVNSKGSPTVDDNASESEPRPRGALVLILIYLLILAAFWVNTYLRIWRS